MASAHLRPTTAQTVSERCLSESARRWIAENLLLGTSADLIASRLLQRGCPLPLALAEIRQASESPYFKGADVLRDRLAKRDWMLATYGRLAAVGGGLETVPLVRDLSADDFFRDYYGAHRPVLIEGLIDDWPALERWSLDYFEQRLGNAVVEIQTRRDSNGDYEAQSDKHKQQMSFQKVLQMLREVEETNDFYMTANNGGHNRQALAALWDDIGQIEDYLDGDSTQDGFFWMGPKGTVTPFHHDLTNNLLVQVRGRKRVTLAPSWDTPLMRNHLHCYSGWSGPEEIFSLPDPERPHLVQCTIEQGQALFIPVGWWHHVIGLDMTIGLSFTNFTRDNGFSGSYTTYGQL